MAERLMSRLAAAVIGRIRGQRHQAMLARRYPEYVVGRGSYGGLTVVEFGEGAKLHLGAYCSIAAGVHVFLGGEHRTDWVTTYPFNALDPRFALITGHPRTRGDVTIGNDVWIGHEAVVMSGVTVGDGAVIGARAVVAKDVAPYTIVAGNPAVMVRSRFPADIVARLSAVGWWNWSEDRIAAAVPLLLSTNIEAFLAAAESGAI